MATKKKVMAAVCIVVALAIFSVSALAAASNLSGYEKLKSALFGMTDSDIDNATISSQIRMVKDGSQVEVISMVNKMDGDKSYSITTSDSDTSETYSDTGTYLFINGDEYYEYAFEGLTYEDESGITATQMRFMELLLDTLVGDVKNYFVSDGDQVSVTLTGQQIPELVQLAVSVIAEEMYKNGEAFNLRDGHDFNFGPDAKIGLASLTGTIDEQDMLTDATAMLRLTSTIDGELQTWDFYVDFQITDIGTTVVTKPDLTGKTEMDRNRYITYNYDDEEYEIVADMIVDRNGNQIVVTQSAEINADGTVDEE